MEAELKLVISNELADKIENNLNDEWKHQFVKLKSNYDNLNANETYRVIGNFGIIDCTRNDSEDSYTTTIESVLDDNFITTLITCLCIRSKLVATITKLSESIGTLSENIIDGTSVISEWFGGAKSEVRKPHKTGK